MHLLVTFAQMPFWSRKMPTFGEKRFRVMVLTDICDYTDRWDGTFLSWIHSLPLGSIWVDETQTTLEGAEPGAHCPAQATAVSSFVKEEPVRVCLLVFSV